MVKEVSVSIYISSMYNSGLLRMIPCLTLLSKVIKLHQFLYIDYDRLTNYINLQLSNLQLAYNSMTVFYLFIHFFNTLFNRLSSVT